MAFEHKVNSGSFFPPSEKAPPSVQLSGECNVDGKVYWVTLWKKDKEDQKHYNISFKPKDTQPAPAPRQEPAEQPPLALDDEIPF